MKTLLQTAPRVLMMAAFAGLGFAQPTLAQSPNGQPVHVDKVADFTYLVRVSNPTQQAAKVQLVRLRDGNVLYQGNSSRPTFGEKINVGSLPDGQYAFVVRIGNQTHRYSLDLHTTRSVALSSGATAMR
ncbi:hypothetical protein D3Y59_12865 [Hymenobacter oligotrophus]|uniref:T9SS C-terminal target domain-containing protein n=1 Tax=Hymenobacter oligotrophus TaxID=2319843 RepID=A0A3B7R1I1_9BACT|nr:hypothetical protein [Hymenobacter oligotrophus]AYA37855.1 hypothetical protein D3Y59_12865 [Hymenobacter oligotrophus]